MEVKQLWDNYLAERSLEHRNALVQHYLHLAKMMASHKAAAAKTLTTRELLGAASAGLIRAVEAFDPSRGVEFENFAFPYIRGGVQDFMREVDTLSRADRRLHSLASEHPTDIVAQKTGHDEQDVKARLETIKAWISSPSDPRGVSEEDVRHIQYVDEHDSLEECVEFLCRVLELDEYAVIFRLHYLHGLTMREIGQQLGLGSDAVSFRHVEAIKQLQPHREWLRRKLGLD